MTAVAHDHIQSWPSTFPETLPIGLDAPVPLPAARQAWRISGGAAEVYLQTPSFRTLLAVVPDGGHVFSMDRGTDSFLSVTGPVGAQLSPVQADGVVNTASETDARLVASADRWIARVAALLPKAAADGRGMHRLAPGERVAVSSGDGMTSGGGVVWALVEPGKMLLVADKPLRLTDLALPLSGPLRATAPIDQIITVASTEALSRQGRLIRSVAAFNSVLPELLGSIRAERDAADLLRLTGETTDETETGRRGAAQAAMTAITAMADVLGADSPPRLKVEKGDLAEMPAIARQAGLRAHRVSLPADWWQRDQGPLIVLERETGHAAAIVWQHRRYVVATTGDTPRRPITRQAAARLATTAFAIRAPLPASVIGFRSLARHLLPRVLRDGGHAVLAGAGMGLLGVLVPMATGWVLGDIVPEQLPGLLLAVGMGLVAAGLFSALFSAARGLAVLRIAGRTGLDLAAAMADRVLSLPPAFFRSYAAGDLNQRIEAVDEMRRLMTTVMVSALITVAFSILYLTLIFIYDSRLGLLSLGLVTVYVAAVALARALQTGHLRRAALLEGRNAGVTYETLAGITKLRVAAAEDRALTRWLLSYAAERRALVSIGRIASHFEAFSDAYQTITLLCLFAAAGLLIGRELPAGVFIAFLVAFGAFQGAFTGFADSLLSVLSAAPMAERARPILTTPSEMAEGRADPGRLSGDIEVSGLAFAYHKGGRNVLEDLDIKIRAGEHIAIVGASGSGKSTLLRLLLGFETPARGSITYDGQDLARLDLSRLRSQIGVVMQSSRLFAGTIQDNIRGASGAGLAACLAAADRAGLAGDLADLPMGLHTPVMEGASTLSGGQRQRLLIARALAANPSILFLDEATSALDNTTQAAVTATLDTLGVTRVTVAHRLSTVREADQICVLSRGRIIESGRFETLMARDGAFAALARRQLTGSGGDA